MNRIKEILEEKGIKQTWLAEQLDKSYNMINSYVQNRRQPSLEDLYKIAQLLDVEVSDLVIRKKDIDFETGLKNDSNVGKTIKIPLLGRVACGNPIFAVENIEAEIPVSIELIKPGHKYFLLKAHGDSMNKRGINDGDLVLVKQQQVAKNGDDIVALIDDEATIKEFNHHGNMIILKPHSTNERHQPIILTEDFKIQGIVQAVIPINK